MLLIGAISLVGCFETPTGTCVDCKKVESQTDTYTIYTYIQACSEKAVVANRENGWSCEDYPTDDPAFSITGPVASNAPATGQPAGSPPNQCVSPFVPAPDAGSFRSY